MTIDLSQPFEHDENMQAFEQEGSILIAVVDETYGRSEDEGWERDREDYRLGLEEEFGLRFEDGNIGPGADLPAFLTLLQSNVEVPAWLIAASIFFAGKPVADNLDVWAKLAKRIRRFFTRPVYFNRYGAAVVAIEALIETLGHPPESLRLLSYRVIHLGEEGDLSKMERSDEIADPLATLYLGFIQHVFEVEADGTMFRIGVDGRQVTVLSLSGQGEN
jgi:hypothetical protein